MWNLSMTIASHWSPNRSLYNQSKLLTRTVCTMQIGSVLHRISRSLNRLTAIRRNGEVCLPLNVTRARPVIVVCVNRVSRQQRLAATLARAAPVHRWLNRQKSSDVGFYSGVVPANKHVVCACLDAYSFPTASTSVVAITPHTYAATSTK